MRAFWFMLSIWLVLLLSHLRRHLDAVCIPNNFISSFQLIYPLDGAEVASVYYHRIEAELAISIDEFNAKNQEFWLCLRAYLLPTDGNIAISIYDKCGLSGFDTVPVPGQPGWNYLEVVVAHEGVELCRASATVHCCTNQTSAPKATGGKSSELASYHYMLEELQSASQSATGPSTTGTFDCTAYWRNALIEIMRSRNHHSSPSTVFVGIKSSSFHVQLRRVLRDTWLRTCRELKQGITILPFFLVGNYRDSGGSAEIEMVTRQYLKYEQSVYKDLLLGEELSAAIDSYHTLAQKVLGFVSWISALHPSLSIDPSLQLNPKRGVASFLDYLLVCDDDVFVDVDQLLVFIGGLKQSGTTAFYGGEVLEYRMNHKFLPQREERHRNFLSRAEYPLDQLPPFALGNFYLLSAENAQFLADNSRVLRPVGTLEDLSVAVWMMGLQVFPTHMSGVCDLERCLYDDNLYSTRDSSNCKSSDESGLIAIAGLKDPFEFELLFNYTRYRAAHYSGCIHKDALAVLKASIRELRRLQQGMQPGSDLPLLAAAFSSASANHYRVDNVSFVSSLHDNFNDDLSPERAQPTALPSLINIVVGCNSMYAVALLKDVISTSTYLGTSTLNWFYLAEDSIVQLAADAFVALTDEVSRSLRHNPPILLLSVLDLATMDRGSGQSTAAEVQLAVLDDSGPLYFGNFSPLREDLTWTAQSTRLLQRAISVVQPDTVIFLSGEPIDLSAMPDNAMFWIDLFLLTLSGSQFLPRWAAFPATSYQPTHSSIVPALYLPVLTSAFHEMCQPATDQPRLRSHCDMATCCSPLDLLVPYSQRMEDMGCKVTTRSRGVAYLYKNCRRPLREMLFDILQSRFRTLGSTHNIVEAVGSCFGSGHSDAISGRVAEDTRFTSSYIERAIEIYKDFRFVIAFENNAAEGYITEKLTNAYLAGAVPIYWGAPDVTDYFNPDSMINCADFKTLQGCADRVVEVYNNATIYEAMSRAIPIKGNDRRERFDNWRRLFPWHAAPLASNWLGDGPSLTSPEYSHTFGAVLREALTSGKTKRRKRAGS